MSAATGGGADFLVCGIAGSLRAASYNRGLLVAARDLAPHGTEVRLFERVGEIPLFNADVEASGDPEPVTALKDAIEEADALLIASPEYNRGVTGVLKNLIDWASRPPRSVMNRKPVALMGATPGRLGTVSSQNALRTSLGSMGAIVLGKPEIFAAAAGGLYAAGTLTDEATLGRVAKLVESLVEWTNRLTDEGEEDPG